MVLYITMKKSKIQKLAVLLFAYLLFSYLTVFSCMLFEKQEINAYFITGSNENKELFRELFNLLKLEENGSEGEFAVTREIAASFARQRDFYRLIHFLNERILTNPSDPYNSYYLLMVAYAHIQMGALPVASMYFDLILNNYGDLIINDESIHLVCLRQLISLNNKPEKQAWYYNELISRFPDKIDLGTAYFMLGQASERIGEWSRALQAYTNYLPYAGTVINGFPNAYEYAKQLVDFSKSSKDWTYESLDALGLAIRDALDAGSVRGLERLMAKVNFFARSWGQTETDVARIVDLNLAEFMYDNRIRYSPVFDESSNATEAYLRTWGWTRFLDIWYLYFRKINFPEDPEIHGRWEWAGIYYGEKF